MLGHMSLKLSLLQKLMPSLSPLPQWWPMALLHILLKEHRSNWKTILRPMHGAPLPIYWISTLRFCCFSGNVYVTCHFSKQKSCFFSLGNITSRYAYLLLIWFCFDIDIALINGLYGASITMLLLRRRIYWTQTSANKGNDFLLILLRRLFISQTKQFQWSDREHSVAVTSNFLKISNRHPRLVFWLILKHLERRMNSNMEALFSLLLMSFLLIAYDPLFKWPFR